MESDPFYEKTLGFCDKAFNDNNIESKLNGCVSCENIQKKEGQIAIFCVSSASTCKTVYKGNSQTDFKEKFVDALATGALIKQNLQLENEYELESNVKIDQDIKSPDKTLIKYDNFNKLEKEVSFDIISENSQDIQCFFNKIEKESVKWKFSDEIKDHSIILSPNIKIPVTLGFKETKKNGTPYNIVMNCYNLPNFSNHFYQTGPFALITFLSSDLSSQVDDEKVPKRNCTETPLIPQCLKKTTKIVKDLLSGSPKEDISDEVEIFAYLTSLEQKIKLELEQQLLNGIKGKNKINQLIKLSELLSQRDCIESPNYETCRTSKKEIEKLFIQELSAQFLVCESIVSKLEKFGYKDLEENVKMALILLTSTTNNADSMSSESDTSDLTKISECLLNSFDTIWGELNTKLQKDKRLKSIKKDLVHLLIKINSNLIHMLHYDELDNHIKAKAEKISRLLLDDKTKNVKTAIEKAIGLIADFGKTMYTDETITIQIISDDTAVSSRRMLRSLEETETETTTSFNEQGIRFKFLQKYLLAKYKANKISLFVYESYPLLSLDNTAIFPKGISIKLLGIDNKAIKVQDIDKRLKILFLHNKMNKPFENCY